MSRPVINQPEGNEYAPEVFQELAALAASFRDRQYFSVANELESIALRGPEPWMGLEQLSNGDVLKLAGERLQRLSK